MIGIIGGSGLYRMEELTLRGEERIKTPFGNPSDAYILGELGGREVVFLPRHGRGHTITPTEINFRAGLAMTTQEYVKRRTEIDYATYVRYRGKLQMK